MTTIAKIGPIELTQAHEIVDPESEPGKMQISIKCSPEQAKQLVGLCQPTNRGENSVPRIISSPETRWGIMPAESPISTVASVLNEKTGYIKGLVALSNPMEYFINIKKCRVVMDAEIVSQRTDEILTILHSKGGEDGSDIEMHEDYVDETTETILTEPFTTFDTTNVWDAKYSENMAAGADITISSGKLQFAGASATNFTWGYLWTCLKEIVPDEFTAEFTLEWAALPAGGAAHHQINLFLVDGKPASKTELEYKDIIRVVIAVESTGATLSVDKRVRGNYSNVSSDIALSSGEKTPAIKIEYSGGSGVSELTVWVDEDYTSGTPTYVKVFGPAKTGVNFDLDRYLILSQENASSTSATTRVAFLNMYTDVAATKPNIVVAPVGAVTDQTPDFYRVGEEGSIPCFRSPVVPPTFQIAPADFYKGSVKAMNTNYTDAVSRLVTGNEFDLDPVKLTLSNGLIKLVPGAQSVAFQYYNGTAWVTLNTFTLPNAIRLIRPFLVTKDQFILQIDRTLWEMRSGRYGIWVKHPNDDLGYTLKPSHYHDGVLNNFTSRGDVSMLTQFYDLIFTPYNMLTTNQYEVETDLSGFVAQGSTITREVGGYSGYCVKTVTNNSASGEGVQLYPNSDLPVTPAVGLPVCTYAWLKGSGSVVLQLIERDSGGNVLSTATSSNYTLSGTYAKGRVMKLISSTDTAMISMKILTPTQQAATIYSDSHGIGPTPNVAISGSTYGPISAARYGMYITKTEPTTILSDSIPASEKTGIGVYDQMQAPEADNGFLSLAREWFRPTWQKTILQSEV